MLPWILILITVIAGSCGDVFCAKGMSSGGPVEVTEHFGLGKLIRSIVTRRMVILGWFCDAVSFFSLLALLSVSQLSLAVPATALSFLFDALGARFILHEQVRWQRWIGVLCITLGVVLTVQSGGGQKLARPGTRVPAPVQTHKH